MSDEEKAVAAVKAMWSAAMAQMARDAETGELAERSDPA